MGIQETINTLDNLYKEECTEENLITFGRAHYSYFNTIFGDETVRAIIKEIYKFKGKLIVENEAAGFDAESIHHVYKPPKQNIICSAESRYQVVNFDVNDTLCQSYSLMSALGISFDKTDSEDATPEQKYQKHKSMIQMYRDILENEKFISILNYGVIGEHNFKLLENWEDSVDENNKFLIVQNYVGKITLLKEVLQNILNIWEKYGWMYFVGKGVCITQPSLNQDSSRQGPSKRQRRGGYRRKLRKTRRIR